MRHAISTASAVMRVPTANTCQCLLLRRRERHKGNSQRCFRSGLGVVRNANSLEADFPPMHLLVSAFRSPHTCVNSHPFPPHLRSWLHQFQSSLPPPYICFSKAHTCMTAHPLSSLPPVLTAAAPGCAPPLFLCLPMPHTCMKAHPLSSSPPVPTAAAPDCAPPSGVHLPGPAAALAPTQVRTWWRGRDSRRARRGGRKGEGRGEETHPFF